MRYVNVAVNLPVKNLIKQFTYLVPPELDALAAGWRVVVPFGSQRVEGFVVGEAQVSAEEAAVCKPVLALLDTEPWFDTEMLQTAQWLSDYYLCSLAEAMRLFIPGKTGLKRKAVKDSDGKLQGYILANRLREKTILTFSITAAGRNALADNSMRAKQRYEALQLLAASEQALTAQSLAEGGISRAVIASLEKLGWCERKIERVFRDSYAQRSAVKAVCELTDEQSEAVSAVNEAAQQGRFATFLLHGITGSGKTEVYLRLTEKALAAHKQVMLLVPEIALTAQIVQRFKAWFGDTVVVAHSKLSPAERADVFYRMRMGQAQILIGVRSAVFAPFAALGLIIMDEEHEGSYKQEERPCYHAKKVALYRAEQMRIPVLLGSATPELEDYRLAQDQTYQYLALTHRPTGNPLPSVEIVDMRAELQSGNRSVLSKKLQQSLCVTIAAGEQAIVLLNRRGFSTFVMCRDCGESIVCPHCSVALVYHSAGEMMRCHYCGNNVPVPTVCPHCGSKRIKFFGTGTQKAESEIAGLPGARVLRMDQDSTSQKFAHEDILRAFAAGEYNILLGTQMVAKGHDIPNVTLVSVLSADTGLNLPDFRAAERTFSLLTQAAGRAGRGSKKGHVLLQAYDAESETLRLAAAQNYQGFAAKELAFRKELLYPPYTSFFKISVLDKSEDKSQALAQEVKKFLLAQQFKYPELHLLIGGPFPALIAKVRDLYRFNLMVRGNHPELLKRLFWQSEFMRLRNVYFDVDPLNVL